MLREQVGVAREVDALAAPEQEADRLGARATRAAAAVVVGGRGLDSHAAHSRRPPDPELLDAADPGALQQLTGAARHQHPRRAHEP